jgi:hypothetical protein
VRRVRGVVHGPAAGLTAPQKGGRPACEETLEQAATLRPFFLPLFTEVLRRGLLGTSPLRGSRKFATASNSHRSTHVAVSSTKVGTYDRYAAYLKYANVRTGRVRYPSFRISLLIPARPSFVRAPPVLCGLQPPVKGGVYLPHNTLRWFYHSGGLGPLGPGPSRNARPLPRGSIHENGFGARRNGHY